MTPKEFKQTLISKKAELLDNSHNKEDISELDIYIKAVMDYQEAMNNALLEEISILKGDLKKDNRERFQIIMDRLDEIEKS